MEGILKNFFNKRNKLIKTKMREIKLENDGSAVVP